MSDISEEAVDTSRARIHKLHSIGCADYIHLALLARAEAAEAERDAGLLREEDANKRAMLHLRRAEKAEIAAKNYSEFNHEWRKLADNAWNYAIEAAAEIAFEADDCNLARNAIRALATDPAALAEIVKGSG